MDKARAGMTLCCQQLCFDGEVGWDIIQRSFTRHRRVILSCKNRLQEFFPILTRHFPLARFSVLAKRNLFSHQIYLLQEEIFPCKHNRLLKLDLLTVSSTVTEKNASRFQLFSNWYRNISLNLKAILLLGERNVCDSCYVQAKEGTANVPPHPLPKLLWEMFSTNWKVGRRLTDLLACGTAKYLSLLRTNLG